MVNKGRGKMKVTIGIITHNRADIISKCLDGIKNQTTKPENIIVVDTSDNDSTRNVIKKFRLPIKYFHLKKRIRQPAARNLILNNTKTEILAFLDDDTVPKMEWLENIIRGYGFDHNIVAVAGPSVNSDINLRPIVAYKYTNEKQNFVNSFGDVRFNCAWVPTRPTECSVMIGANMSFLTKELKSVGGFYDFYREGYGFREENFPQMKLIRKGKKFMYMPKAFVWHIKTREGGADKNYEHFYLCGKYHKIFADRFFPRWKSRLSWFFWSVSPPCLWLCILLAIYRWDFSILRWHKGLWGI